MRLRITTVACNTKFKSHKLLFALKKTNIKRKVESLFSALRERQTRFVSTQVLVVFPNPQLSTFGGEAAASCRLPNPTQPPSCGVLPCSATMQSLPSAFRFLKQLPARGRVLLLLLLLQGAGHREGQGRKDGRAGTRRLHGQDLDCLCRQVYRTAVAAMNSGEEAGGGDWGEDVINCKYCCPSCRCVKLG